MDTNSTGGFSSSDAVLFGAMNNMGRNNGSGGAWGGGYSSVAPFAGPASNAVRINRNKDLSDAYQSNLSLSLDRAEESRQFGSVKDNQFRGELRTNDHLSSVCDAIHASELRTNDRLRDAQREADANARVAATCCCDNKVLVLEKFADLSKQQAVDNGTTQAKLAAVEAKIDANKEIAELRAELQTQKIFATCGCGCAGGVSTCP